MIDKNRCCFAPSGVQKHHPNTCHLNARIRKGIEATDMRFLVGGMPTPLKNMLVRWDDYLIYEMESHKIPWFQTTNQIVTDSDFTRVL